MFVGRYFLSVFYNPEDTRVEEYIKMTPAEKYLGLSLQPGINNTIVQMFYSFLLRKYFEINKYYFLPFLDTGFQCFGREKKIVIVMVLIG